VKRAPLILLLTAACGSVTPPDRPAPYAYAVPVPDGFEVVFHWPPASLPVRVWAEQSLEFHAGEAIRTWEALSLYGEFRGVLVRDSARADIVIIRLPEREFRGNPSELLACHGSTVWSVNLDTKVMTLPFLTFLTPRAGAGAENVDGCFTIVATHELGHSLGLLLESADPADLMHDRPTTRVPTARDRVSFTALYHSVPTATVPPNR
jgi:predicted Zn-dependent protease